MSYLQDDRHNTRLQLPLLSAAVLGFRHGFNRDRIVVITDITSVQSTHWHRSRGTGAAQPFSLMAEAL